MDILMQHLGKGLGIMLLLSMPAVLMAAGIGLVIGILQAVTQVQEQTISSAPKIVGVFLLIIFGGPFMMDIMRDYFTEATHLSFDVIPRDEAMVLPPKPLYTYGQGDTPAEFFKEQKQIPSDSKIKALMEKPPNLSGFNGPEKAIIDNSHRPVPRPGIGEQIYMQRRAEGKLPKPPGSKE